MKCRFNTLKWYTNHYFFLSNPNRSTAFLFIFMLHESLTPLNMEEKNGLMILGGYFKWYVLAPRILIICMSTNYLWSRRKSSKVYLYFLYYHVDGWDKNVGKHLRFLKRDDYSFVNKSFYYINSFNPVEEQTICPLLAISNNKFNYCLYKSAC